MKHQEEVLYLFWGGLTFVFGISVYILLVKQLYVHELIANVSSWIVGVTFSFFTTKKWVFVNNEWSIKYVIRQMCGFYVARASTLILQELLLYVFVTQMGLHKIGIKIGTEIINIILNYIASKFIVFGKRKYNE